MFCFCACILSYLLWWVSHERQGMLTQWPAPDLTTQSIQSKRTVKCSEKLFKIHRYKQEEVIRRCFVIKDVLKNFAKKPQKNIFVRVFFLVQVGNLKLPELPLEVFYKKGALKNSQISQENTCVGDFFCIFTKKTLQHR